jgi:hypothetical protein
VQILALRIKAPAAVASDFHSESGDAINEHSDEDAIILASARPAIDSSKDLIALDRNRRWSLC